MRWCRGALVAAAIGLLGAIGSRTLVAQELPFRHFTTENQIASLPSSSVQQVMQDRQGYIWFAFYSSGIGRYDGNQIELFTTADGLPELTTRELVQDRAGYLWVGTEGGLAVSERPLAAYGPGVRMRFISRVGDVQLPRTRIRRNWMTTSTDGALWVGTTGSGLLRFDRQGGVLAQRRISTAVAAQTAERAVLAVAARDDGRVVASLEDGTILLVEAGGQGQAIPQVPSSPVSAFGRSSDGGLWAGTMRGEVWRSDRQLRFSRRATVGSSRVFTVFERRPGDVWVASLGDGVARITPAGDVRLLTRLSGLLSESVWSITTDREQNLWFAQNGGVSRLSADFEAFRAYTGVSHTGEDPLLPDSGAFSLLAPLQNGGELARYLWVGTGRGLAAIDNGRRAGVLSPAEGMRGAAVYSLAYAGDGALWAGTVDGANRIATNGDDTVVRFDGRDLRLRSFDLGGPVYAIEPGPASTGGGQWLAGQGGVHLFRGSTMTSFSEVSGLPSTGATSLAFGADGRLWVGTADAGLFRSEVAIDARTLDHLTPEALRFRKVESSGGGVRGSIHGLVSVGGELWVGSSHGLFLLDALSGDVRARFDASSGLGGTNVMSLALRGSELWVAQNAGLAMIDTKRRTVVRIVDKRHGLLDNEVWSYSAVDVGDSVYVATARGVAVYDPARDLVNTAPPTPVIRRAEYRENRSGENELAVEYAALSFVSEESVHYRTRLAGYDDWTERGTESKIRYTNLPAFLFDRRYDLEVIGVSADGVESRQAVRLPVLVRPALWLRAWFLALLLAAVAAFSVFVYRYRTARFAKMNRELEAIVKARTEKIAAQTNELRTFDRIVGVINGEVRLEPLLEALLEQGMLLFPRAEKAAFLVFDRYGERCEVAASRGYDRELLRDLSFTAEEAVRRYCENAEFLGEGVYLARHVPKLPGRDGAHLPEPRVMLSMEVAIGGMLEGFLVFDNFSDPNAFDSSDVEKLSRFRQHAISAIAKARMLRELEVKNREAEQASQAKSAFLANMSHELRTPLNSIIGFSEILVERFDRSMEPRFVNFLRLILASGQHLLTLINDVLDLSKIEAGKMDVYPDTVHLQHVVESVSVVMRPLSTKKDITIHLDLPSEPIRIETDPGKLKQILYNLLSNAVKFSPHGTAVHVQASLKQSDLLLSVRDEGIGIEPENLELIFEEFRQIDSSARRKYEGTGLGLSLVKKLVELQGGEVHAESLIGEGSTFLVRMPVRVLGLHEALIPGDEASHQVLVVEDDDGAFETLRRHLAAAGYRAVRARVADEALNLARMLRPAAITLDLILPGSDGLEVLKRLKADEATSHIPVIIVSMTESRELAMALGADDYLIKPIDPAFFKRRIQELIVGRGLKRRPLLMVVDDDVTIHQVLEESLLSAGFEVITAINGDEAFDLLSRHSPDVVVLDLTLPGMSGFDIAARLKSDPETAQLPIVVFTSRDLSLPERQELERHAIGLVPKGERSGTRLIEALHRLDVARPMIS